MVLDVDLQLALAARGVIFEEAHRLRAAVQAHRLQLLDVAHRHPRIVRGLVLGREGALVVPGELAGLVGRTNLGQQVQHLVQPRAGQVGDRRGELLAVRLGETLGGAAQ